MNKRKIQKLILILVTILVVTIPMCVNAAYKYVKGSNGKQIILGDVTGNGKIDYGDLYAMKVHIYARENDLPDRMLKGDKLLAANIINTDRKNDIYVNDLLAMRQYLAAKDNSPIAKKEWIYILEEDNSGGTQQPTQPEQQPEPVEEIEPTGVEVSQKEINQLSIGGTVELKVTVKPANAKNKTVTWKSSNTKVATVDKNGKITGIGEGTAIITVTTSNGKQASCTVKVEKSTMILKTNNKEITNNMEISTAKGYNVLRGTEFTITPTLKGISNKNITWTTSNVSDVTINGKEKVSTSGSVKIKISDKSKEAIKTNKQEGVTITAKAADGTTKTFRIKVGATNIKLADKYNKKTIDLNRGKILKLPTPTVENLKDKTVTWTSNNKELVTVNRDGTVKVKYDAKSNKNEGTVKIVAKTANGAETYFTIHIPKTEIEMNPVTVNKGEAKTLSIKLKGIERGSKVRISSNNKAVITLDNDQRVIERAVGDNGIVKVRLNGKESKAVSLAKKDRGAILKVKTENGQEKEIKISLPKTEIVLKNEKGQIIAENGTIVLTKGKTRIFTAQVKGRYTKKGTLDIKTEISYYTKKLGEDGIVVKPTILTDSTGKIQIKLTPPDGYSLGILKITSLDGVTALYNIKINGNDASSANVTDIVLQNEKGKTIAKNGTIEVKKGETKKYTVQLKGKNIHKGIMINKEIIYYTNNLGNSSVSTKTVTYTNNAGKAQVKIEGLKDYIFGILKIKAGNITASYKLTIKGNDNSPYQLQISKIEKYEVKTKYNKSTFNITYDRNPNGRYVVKSVKRISNIMYLPYFNQNLNVGGRYKGTGDPSISSNYDHDYTHHSYNGRNDSGWACGPFSYAMIASYLNDKIIPPYNHYNSAGWWSNMGSKYNCIKREVSRDAESLKAQLLLNRPVLLGVTQTSSKPNTPFTDGSHILTITGVTEDGKFTVNNPNDFFIRDNYFNGPRYTSYINEDNPKRTSWTWSQIYDLARMDELKSYSSELSTRVLNQSREIALNHAKEVVRAQNERNEILESGTFMN